MPGEPLHEELRLHRQHHVDAAPLRTKRRRAGMKIGGSLWASQDLAAARGRGPRGRCLGTAGRSRPARWPGLSTSRPEGR